MVYILYFPKGPVNTMIITHNLGFPRIGIHRNLKFSIEAYWKKENTAPNLQKQGKEVRAANWKIQHDAGLSLLPTNDFSWYDHVLDTSYLLGVIPHGFRKKNQSDLDLYFRIARGDDTITASEMTKWFDTNYHYIVPEFSPDQKFKLNSKQFFSEIKEAQNLKYNIKPVLLGPLTFLWQGKTTSQFNKLSLLKQLIPCYQTILIQLEKENVEWVQIDEPILSLDLSDDWQDAFRKIYLELGEANKKICLTTYFGNTSDYLPWLCKLPIAGIHLDAVSHPTQITQAANSLSKEKILSVGIIDGRNIWRNNLRQSLHFLQPLYNLLGERLWLAPSCSLLHCPVDLSLETKLKPELKNRLAFSVQKLEELALLSKALTQGQDAIHEALNRCDIAFSQRSNSHTHTEKISNLASRTSPYKIRKTKQQQALQLPLFPTTTIGSLSQTSDLRTFRHLYKTKKLNEKKYKEKIQHYIADGIKKQEQWGLDVLVHGEFERSDMVEYFGEHLEGFVITENGWVQSYGSRCVKPPIIYGDVFRPKPITTEWIGYAQSLTTKPVKGMLTGPNTIVSWSFVRDDIPIAETTIQVALALRDEVIDLEKIGIKVIQIDEPAFRERLPLRKNDWQAYLDQAVFCFKLTAGGVKDETQIHTHMCYSKFNDIIDAIAQLDADVITIETSRSKMELLHVFENFKYPNEIGPGVYDVHSPRLPKINEITELLEKATTLIPFQQLWVNPDCGLKTRTWEEIEISLKNMVAAAHILRKKFEVKRE